MIDATDHSFAVVAHHPSNRTSRPLKKKSLFLALLAASRAHAQNDALSRKLGIINTFVVAGGSGSASDVALMSNELAKLPVSLLQRVADDTSFRMIAIKNNATDWPELAALVDPKGLPRGYSLNSTYADVQGVYFPRNNTALVAVTNTAGRVLTRADRAGQASIPLHELGHFIDYSWGPRAITVTDSLLSSQVDFAKARTADIGSLDTYFLQAGLAGRTETFAEYFGQAFNNVTARDPGPNLFRYFRSFLCGYGVNVAIGTEATNGVGSSCVATISSPYPRPTANAITTTTTEPVPSPVVTSGSVRRLDPSSSSNAGSVSRSSAQRTAAPAAIWQLVAGRR